MSEDFHKSFMQKDTRDSYMGIKPGMTRAEVEKRYGSSNRVFHKTGMDYLYTIYGNLAVAYELKGNKEVVREIGVAPLNVDEQTFIDKYSDYDKNNDAGSYTYNTVKNNGFEILVTTKNGKIALIQCIQRIITSEKLKRLGVWRMQNGNNVLLLLLYIILLRTLTL